VIDAEREAHSLDRMFRGLARLGFCAEPHARAGRPRAHHGWLVAAVDQPDERPVAAA
jgi:hypothetical protein